MKDTKRKLFRYSIGLVSMEEEWDILIDAKNKKEAYKIARKLIRTNPDYTDMEIKSVIRLTKHGEIMKIRGKKIE